MSAAGSSATTSADVNVTRLIDDGAVTSLQVKAIVLCSLVAFVDGLDSQSIAVAAPAIADSLGLQRAALGPIFSAGLLGATVGALVCGPLSDRFGRKQLLVWSVVSVGIFLALTATCSTYASLLAMRFCTGIGLGGAVPCYLALSAEYAPSRRRATITSLIWAAFPLGGALGGVMNALVLQRFGWQSLFLIGGAVTMVTALVLAVWLPESVRYLISNNSRPDYVGAIVSRLRPGTPAGARYTTDEEKADGVPLRQMFSDGRAVGTLLLWVPFFMGFGVLSIIVVWTPILLRDGGIPLSQVAVVLGVGGIGPIVGMAVAGRLVEKFGAPALLIPSFLLGSLTLGLLGYAAVSVPAITATLFFIGLFIGAGASGSIALAAVTYPTAIRSSGIGWAMGIGRFGQVLAPLLATVIVAAGWSDGQLFIAFAVAPVLAALAVLARRGRSRPTATGL